jgi:dimethylargininase
MTLRPTLNQRLVASALAGLTVAATAYVISLLALFLAFQATATNLGPIAVYFAGPAVAVFILLSVAGVIDGLATWLRALVFSVIVAVLGTYIGALVYFAAGGDPMSTALGDAQKSLVNNNLVFAFVVIIAGVLLGRRVYRESITRSTAGTTAEIHRAVLVRAPASTLAKGQVTHVKRRVVKVAKANEQWTAYVSALADEGFETIELEASEAHPDSVFIEDTVVMLGQTAIIGSPGAESRRGEQDAVESAVAELELATQHIRLPGTLDGGDVLKVGSTVYVGRGGRTNAEGIRQFRAIAGELGYTVVAVPVTRALHLKSTVTALPDGTVIGHPSVVDHPELFERYLEVPEVQGIAVVVLSPSAVLIAASAPKTAELLADLGYRVVSVDISEFEKLEGCVTCLSVRIR